MKIVIEVKEMPKNNDIIIWNEVEKCFIPMDKDLFLRNIVKEQKRLEKKFDDEMTSLKEQLNAKLKDYHDNIRILVEGVK